MKILKMHYAVRPIICDYGIYKHTDNERKLIEICNKSDNANMIAEILNADLRHEIWKPEESEVENED